MAISFKIIISYRLHWAQKKTKKELCRRQEFVFPLTDRILRQAMLCWYSGSRMLGQMSVGVFLMISHCWQLQLQQYNLQIFGHEGNRKRTTACRVILIRCIKNFKKSIAWTYFSFAKILSHTSTYLQRILGNIICFIFKVRVKKKKSNNIYILRNPKLLL